MFAIRDRSQSWLGIILAGWSAAGFLGLIGLRELSAAEPPTSREKVAAAVEKATALALLQEAGAALQRADYAETIKLASELIAADPKDARALLLRASAYERSHEPLKALADYDAALKLEAPPAYGFQNRGELHFRLGHFAASVADFDKVIALAPEKAPHHWQRGISLYYAGRYEAGRKQFELHQTVNPHDVENAVWHFLCVTKASGLAKARDALIPIDGDARIPMKQVHALFAGRAQPEDVVAAASTGDPAGAQRENQLFYAHLYLGLYFDAIGDLTLAREHILKAAAFKADHYMGDVARVHAQLLRGK